MMVFRGSFGHEVNPCVDVVFLCVEVDFCGCCGGTLADHIACPYLFSHPLAGIGSARGINLNLIAHVVVAVTGFGVSAVNGVRNGSEVHMQLHAYGHHVRVLVAELLMLA